MSRFGGVDCDPVTGSAGQGECEYFNPFSSSFVIPNTQTIIYCCYVNRFASDAASNWLPI
ncbi:hypothetical protein GPAL_2570 [Glaciecola pallidula DSM 14239 = ACAM 615]|uniref:Uncharacterized protein n=1 Tax=Brumicola pallidula DSM 14239 = ACAM 615 TaxID=1121922 RepID=K6ZGF3_9ALTE|nr:hypothetical protein GPAL_2570 [Glaciecola pallidula DSM 14239 = ACAM 615]